jgi:cation diffusion facilitator CzcD-associated flavoprotein CzcO
MIEGDEMATKQVDRQAAVATNVDVVIVGAGFAGMYQLKRMRDAGFSAVVIEAGNGVGGTWYWNRYPGARCDILTVDYSYSWDPELEAEWEWSERYATQPEILRYANFVADKHDLRRDIRFETRVTAASWGESGKQWTVSTTGGDVVAQHYVMATGCLSVPKVPDVAGNGRFEGATYSTGAWPHEGVDFTGMRVAVIGTGSSGIQSIPIIAEQAAQLTVFQRTPNFSMPAHHGPISDERLVEYREDPVAYREDARHSQIGVPFVPVAERKTLEVSPEEREAAYEATWQRGELGRLSPFTDLGVSAEANDTMRRFIHDKIRGIVDDPQVAETLCPTNHYFATKRPCLDTDYYATYNRPNVRLVDLLNTPIESITEAGIDVTGESMEFDAIVFATGFDAMTGAIVGANITGRDGMSLRDAWADGPKTYLGLMSVGFPNLYMITGPGSPSVLSNMMVSIEQHVDWISDLLDQMRTDQMDTIEPTVLAQTKWVQHSNAIANMTLLPTANSWYMGANVPGKPSVFLPYPGGVGAYRAVCDEVVERGYFGFTLAGTAGSTTNDGVIRAVQPDVAAMLAAMAEMDLPPLESLSVDDARAFMDMAAGLRPPGPDVGEITDGVLQGADGELEYRLYRPASPGPHPVVVYFHGGGWEPHLVRSVVPRPVRALRRSDHLGQLSPCP